MPAERGNVASSADVIVVGAGLAGLVAAVEVAGAGRRVIVVDQEPEQSLGGQAFWSLGGLFLVNSPEQRRLGIRDSHELALQDWMGSAGFDRDEDRWPRRWAEAYVDWTAGEKRAWLHARGVRFFPIVGWAERGGSLATDKVDSAHLLAHRMRGRIYVGVAEIDASFPREQQNRLEQALSKAGVDYTIETYRGAKHGFAVTGHLVYDRDASERHWRRLLGLLRETLSAQFVS